MKVEGFPKWQNSSFMGQFNSDGSMSYEDWSNEKPTTKIEISNTETIVSHDLDLYKNFSNPGTVSTGFEKLFTIDHGRMLKVPYMMVQMMWVDFTLSEYESRMWMHLEDTFEGHTEENWKSILKGMINFDFYWNQMLLEHHISLKDAKNYHCLKDLWENMEDFGLKIHADSLKEYMEYDIINALCIECSEQEVMDILNGNVNNFIEGVCDGVFDKGMEFVEDMFYNATEMREMVAPIVTDIYEVMMDGFDPSYQQENGEGYEVLVAQEELKNHAKCQVAEWFVENHDGDFEWLVGNDLKLCKDTVPEITDALE